MRGGATAWLAAVVLGAFPAAAAPDWPVYNGDPQGTHYSPLIQINRGNVAKLKVAWSFDAGGAGPASELEANPIVVNGTMYVLGPTLEVIALDAASGAVKWRFDPHEGAAVRSKQRSRGVTFWSDGHEARIFANVGQYIYGLDARSGRPALEFGKAGRVDMREGLDRDPAELSISNPSPGIVYKGLLIEGGSGQAPGHIRAYDARTGAIRWTFHTIPRPGEAGYETWPPDAWKRVNGANAWAGLALDPAHGIVFASTGSAGAGDRDFYGADRLGDNLFANSILALDAATGRRIWHFQTVRHDIWDRDLPAPPTLVTLRRDGKSVAALVQITKTGVVYVLDRLTGKSLFPLEERSVATSDIPGEQAAIRQPMPLSPAPFARQRLTEAELTQRTPQAHDAVLARFRKLRSTGQFTPGSREGTVLFPGFDGGGEYGGTSYDPQTHLAYINANDVAYILQLKENAPETAALSRRGLYLRECSSCHGADLKGNPPQFPSLVDLKDRMGVYDVTRLLLYGGGRMPSFRNLGSELMTALARYVVQNSDEALPRPEDLKPDPDLGRRFTINGYQRFLDPDGYPAVAPPWGTLSALNLDTGEYTWRIPFGDYPELAAKGIAGIGTENYGGSVVTAGGLLFIGATIFDNRFRAFDKRTGKLLWQTPLDASAIATPATYMVGGRQFVVVAVGGGKNDKVPTAAKYVAFALPASHRKAGDR